MNTSVASTAPGFLLNGQPVSMAGCSVQTTLLDFLRARGLTGAKEGCAEGECGACTILRVAANGAGSAYQSVNSCLIFLPSVAGQEIYTVESLATCGELAPAQKTLAAAGGSQCGYCTPGFVMSLFAEHYRPGREGPCRPQELGGNLCRCTGYRPIRDAAFSLGPAPAGPFLDRLSRSAPQLGRVAYVDPEAARFSRPVTLDECFSILAADPDARVVAGATDLGVESNLRNRRWGHLVSLEGIDELREFSETPESFRIGAALSLSEIEARCKVELLHQWLPLFASPPLRNRATLGGNLGTASPIGDGAPMLMALDAILHLASAAGTRMVPLADFCTGYRITALQAGELIAIVEIPKPLPAFSRFYKVAKRRLDDISTVAAAMALSWDDSARIARARFAFGGVAPVPLRVVEAEQAVLGRRWNEAAVERVQAILDRSLRPLSDHRGSAEYRLAVAKSLVEKFLWEQREACA